MASVRTSILRETSTPTRPPTRSTRYTLVREEPAISTVALSTGTWIGIAVGVALLLAIAVFIGIQVGRRAARKGTGDQA